MSDLKQLISECKDCTLHKVNVPEWGCDVYIKEVDFAEFIEATNVDPSTPDKDSMVRTLAIVLCDENGKQIFENTEILSKKNFKVCYRLFNESLKINMIEKAIEEAAKN
tara:strand:+ start:2950 stop:3276 length:327 start_codon:yes stop_codon:yes gene_type:complete